MNFEELPIMTQAAAWKLLREAERDVNACGDSGVAVGYWVASHTIGCQTEGDATARWNAHIELWEKYSDDGVSILIGDPPSGAFVFFRPFIGYSSQTVLNLPSVSRIDGLRSRRPLPVAASDSRPW